MKIILNYFDKHPFAKAGLLAIPLVLIMLGMDYYFPKSAPEGYKSFIIAFEFARTPADLHTVLQPYYPGDIKNIDTGNYLDFGFMLVYSALLAFFFRKASVVFNIKWLLAGVLLSIIILMTDGVENVYLLKITRIYQPDIQENHLTSLLKTLQIITSVKWFGLAVVFSMVSVILFKRKWFMKMVAIGSILPMGIAIGGNMQSPAAISAFTNSVFLAFGILILFMLAFREKKS